MSIEVQEVQSKAKSGARNAAVSFKGKLDSGELLTGTPTAVEMATSDLTISNVGVSTKALTINDSTVSIGEAVQFKVVGGIPGRIYRIRVTGPTDSTPAQSLVTIVRVKVIADGT